MKKVVSEDLKIGWHLSIESTYAIRLFDEVVSYPISKCGRLLPHSALKSLWLAESLFPLLSFDCYTQSLDERKLRKQISRVHGIKPKKSAGNQMPQHDLTVRRRGKKTEMFAIWMRMRASVSIA